MNPEISPPSRRDKPLILVAEDAGIQIRLTQICLEKADYADRKSVV